MSKENHILKPRLLVFASGTATGGGSGFENLVVKAREGVLSADIVGVVSNHEHGGVRTRADRLGVKFFFLPTPWNAAQYRRITNITGARFFALSGWLKRAVGLPPQRTFNVNPGPLPAFGGDGMYGHHVHEAVMVAFRRGEITHSAVCMHFVVPEYDRGPLFFRYNVKIRDSDTPETLAERVNKWEHFWQPQITNLVVQGEISWDGANPESLQYPDWYRVEGFDEK